MNNLSIKKDSFLKIIFRSTYRFFLGIYVFISTIKYKSREHDNPSVFYGGARSGNYGGPLVKVKRLQEHFNEHLFNYNLLYVLSNAPYLPEWSYKLIKTKNIPIVLNQNGVFYEAWYQGNWKQENTRMSIPYHLANYVFYQSKFCKKAANKYLGRREGDSEILYNAVNTDFFKPNKDISLNKKDKFIFLLSGRINNHLFYRVECSIKALGVAISEGLNAELIIAGGLDYDVSKRSKALINKLKINNSVNFVGSYKQEEAPSIYNCAHAYIMTKHNDPCPNTVIEAMSCGLPILYSKTGGVPELVGADAGIGLECEENWQRSQTPLVKDISNGMLEIANKYEQMSNSARNRAVENFDIKYWIKKT